MTSSPPNPLHGATEPAIGVLVVEDDRLMRDEFTTMIRATPGLVVWGEADSLAAARAQLTARAAPDVAIIDLGLPDGDGTDLIRQLAANVPGVSVLVATVFGDEGHVMRALEAGAQGYLLKDTSLDELVRAVRLVRDGGSPLSPQIARHLLRRFAVPPPRHVPPLPATDAPEKLSPREAQILTLISQGQTVAEVALALHLSAHTVTTHVKHIYEKLAVNNRIQAVNRARETGQIR